MSITLEEHAGFSVDQRVYLREATQGSTFVEVGGEDREDEITYPAGTPALITQIDDFGGAQGIAFTVQIGEITNVFDQEDGPITDFLSAEPLPLPVLSPVLVSAIDWITREALEFGWERDLEPKDALAEAVDLRLVAELSGNEELIASATELRDRAQKWVDELPAKAVTFDTTISLSAEKISDQVVTAVEGGIAYWSTGFYLVQPSRADLTEKPWYADPKLYEGDFKIRVVQEEEHKAGAGRDVFLTPDSVRTGLKVMAEKYGSHFADMVQENGDATTADVFLQCCVFGDLIYG